MFIHILYTYQVILCIHKCTYDGSAGEEYTCSAEDTGDAGLLPGSGTTPGEGSPVFLLEKSPGQQNLTGYSPKGHNKFNTTE